MIESLFLSIIYHLFTITHLPLRHRNIIIMINNGGMETNTSPSGKGRNYTERSGTTKQIIERMGKQGQVPARLKKVLNRDSSVSKERELKLLILD